MHDPSGDSSCFPSSLSFSIANQLCIHEILKRKRPHFSFFRTHTKFLRNTLVVVLEPKNPVWGLDL